MAEEREEANSELPSPAIPLFPGNTAAPEVTGGDRKPCVPPTSNDCGPDYELLRCGPFKAWSDLNNLSSANSLPECGMSSPPRPQDQEPNSGSYAPALI